MQKKNLKQILKQQNNSSKSRSDSIIVLLTHENGSDLEIFLIHLPLNPPSCSLENPAKEKKLSAVPALIDDAAQPVWMGKTTSTLMVMFSNFFPCSLLNSSLSHSCIVHLYYCVFSMTESCRNTQFSYTPLCYFCALNVFLFYFYKNSWLTSIQLGRTCVSMFFAQHTGSAG